MRHIVQSKKLQNVRYDVRGPILVEAERLEAQGNKILKLNIGDNIKRFDGCCHKHYHATCLNCGRIFDIAAQRVPNLELELPGFIVTETNLSFEGYCAGCASQ